VFIGVFTPKGHAFFLCKAGAYMFLKIVGGYGKQRKAKPKSKPKKTPNTKPKRPRRP